MIMLQHISPHFVASTTTTTTASKSSTETSASSQSSSGGDSPGTSHDRSPSPPEVRPHCTPSPLGDLEDVHQCDSPAPGDHQSGDESCEELKESSVVEPPRRLQTAAMKKAMDTSPTRIVAKTNPDVDDDDVEEEEDEDIEDEDKSRPNSRCESPPQILTNRVSISQRLSDKYSGSIIRRALKASCEGERDPVVVLNHQRLLLRDRRRPESPRLAMEEDEDTDSNVPLDLSLNAEEKMQREQTELFLRQHKKDDAGTESDDSGGPGEDRGRAYKKSLMKRYCEYRGSN